MVLIRLLRNGALASGLAGLAAAAMAAAPLIEEGISPARITLGDSAQITVKTSGNDLEPPELPAVAGLEFRVIDRLHGIELIHGASLATTTTLVRVTPQRAGTFIIPEITPRAPPLTLRVEPANVPTGLAAPQRGIGSAAAEGIHMMQDDDAFIRMTVPRHEVYVGESVPLSIEVGMRAGVVTSLNGLPALDGSDFTLNDLSRRPQRNERIIDDKPYIVLTWHSVLAPVKPGEFSLSVAAPMTIRVSTRPRQEAQLEDRLGDPFMQRIFGSTVSRPLQAVSPRLTLSVSPLPAEGRPPQFSGAVGKFTISSEISAAAASAGDPLTLRMHVVGSGNFDRVDSLMLQHVEGWKTYPPTSSFKPADPGGLKGDKTFEQPVIASQYGLQSLPALTFTYFDPESRAYDTVRAAPLTVTISPSRADSNPGLLPLRPDRKAPGKGASELTPLYLQPRFLAIPSLLGLIGVGAWFPGGRRGVVGARRPSGRASAAARRMLASLEAAARSGDSARFFDIARRLLQQELAARWQLRPADVTAAEVDARLGGEGAEIRQLLALAEESLYAARASGGLDLSRWVEVVRRNALPGRSA